MRKIPTMFVRDFERDHGRYVTEDVTPGCEWVLAGEGVATVKWDGTCVMVDRDGAVWARREVKAGKTAPAGFRALETDDETGKTVGWEPAEQSSFAKIIAEVRPTHLTAGTYELVGPKVNGNPENAEQHELRPHGTDIRDVPDRSYAGLRGFLAANPGMEGIVFWRRPGDLGGGLAKIKARDFPAADTGEHR